MIGVISGARRFGVSLAGARAQVGFLVGAMALAWGAGGAGAQSGHSGAAAAHVYFAYGYRQGWIVEANPNGSHAKTIVRRQHHPTGLAVSGRHLYWANAGRQTILEAKLNGTNAKAIVKRQPGVYGMAVRRHLYWISGDTIVEARLNGTNVKTIATGQRGPVAVAVGGGHLYWAIPGGFSSNDGMIVEANLNGTDVKTIAQGQPTPSGVAVSGNHLYWSNGYSNTIVKANLDGTDAKTIVDEPNAELLGDLAAGAGHLYWGSYDSFDPYWTLVVANLDGTHPRPIAQDKALPQAVAVGP